jgi:chromosome segregation ATPase
MTMVDDRHRPPPQRNGRSSADEFLQEHRVLQQEVEQLRRELAQVTVSRDVYANTCGEQVEKIERLETALRRVTRYVTAMRTRMKMIMETITAADREASEFAYEEPKPEPRPEPKPRPSGSPVVREMVEAEDGDLQRFVGGPRNQNMTTAELNRMPPGPFER